MSILASFTGTYCTEETAIGEIARRTGYTYVTDDDIVSKASILSGINKGRIQKVFRSRTSVFNQFTHEKELSVAHLKLATAETLAEDKIFINGFTSLLIPSSILDVLRICIISDMKSRVSAAGALGIPERDAFKMLHKHDENRAAWVKYLWGKNDPWEPSLYDMVLPTDKMSSQKIGDMVVDTLERSICDRTSSVKKSVEDFVLAARIEAALIKEGHYYVTAETDAGAVTLTINKNVLMLKWLEKKLQSIVEKVSGVTYVTTEVGRQFYQPDIVRKFSIETPSKPFLADDKRLFVPMWSKKAVVERNRLYNRT